MSALNEKIIYNTPECLTEKVYHFCPGCHHGLVHRLAAEAIDEFGLAESAVGVIGVGCGVFLYDYIAVDCCEAPHGRAPAVASGIKRTNPKSFVFTYQGDGDLAAIGTSEIIHSANRQENITVIFVNNSVYGMTGGQMAPTTLPGQKTTTTPAGRIPAGDGFPINMAELIASFRGTAFSARVSLHDNINVRRARKAMNRAFQAQVEKRGFSMVELLSACPTNWRLSPKQSLQRITDEMIPAFPLGTFKDF
ncbi:MAG: thiamine pyrophosphate-dependent enzyme [Dethiobacteria bacterium]|nr:2-oxoglutarate oxidoreductase [Bacillota bacterium]MDW7730027.1 thiamine pyrophosphate-dependent enzyme [Bacillota bacterium]